MKNDLIGVLILNVKIKHTSENYFIPFLYTDYLNYAKVLLRIKWGYAYEVLSAEPVRIGIQGMLTMIISILGNWKGFWQEMTLECEKQFFSWQGAKPFWGQVCPSEEEIFLDFSHSMLRKGVWHGRGLWGDLEVKTSASRFLGSWAGMHPQLCAFKHVSAASRWWATVVVFEPEAS